MSALAFPPVFSTGLGTAFTTTLGTGPLLEIQTSPTDRLIIAEIIVSIPPNNSNGFSCSLSLGVPATAGVGKNSFGAALYEDSSTTNAASGARLYTAWTTLPVIPTNFLRRRISGCAGAGGGNNFSAPVTTGFRFPRGYNMSPSSSLALWVLLVGSANQTLGLWFDIDVMVDG